MVGIREKVRTLAFALSATLAMAAPTLALAQQIGLGPIGAGVPRGAIGTIGIHNQGDILDQSDDVNRLLLQESHRLSPSQRAQVSQLLTQITSVVLSGGHIPRPGQPLPPPHYPPPYRPELRCAQEPHHVMAQTFEIIKDFAYSISGLNMNSRQSTDFAQQWVNEHACRSAQPYMREVRLLRNYAYSISGLNLSSQAAVNYAMQNLNRICHPNVDLLPQHRSYYDFAYSSRGLNMSSHAATQYARENVESQHLRCNGLPEVLN